MGYSGDGGPGTLAMLGSPASVSVSSDSVTGGGSVFIADSQFNNIRQLFFNGTIRTVRGRLAWSIASAIVEESVIKVPLSFGCRLPVMALLACGGRQGSASKRCSEVLFPFRATGPVVCS